MVADRSKGIASLALGPLLSLARQMQVIAVGPTLTPERARASEVEFVSPDELFPRSDAVLSALGYLT